MGTKNKTSKKIDLLKLSDSEKINVIREVRQNLRQKLAEAKLWQSFVEAEKLTINGEKICFEDADLKGLSYEELAKH